MTHFWRNGAWLVGLLVIAHTADVYFFRYLLALTNNAIENSMPLPFAFVEFDLLVLLFDVILFLIVGAILAACAASPPSPLVLSVVLGLLFSAVHFFGGPRSTYSHGPLWLHMIAHADLYAPAIAAVVGAFAWRKLRPSRNEARRA